MKIELEYFPDGGGASVKKTLADWGIADDFSGAFREQVADELTLTLPGRALADDEFIYKSRVIITIDGRPFFCGYVIDDPREGDGFTNRAAVNLAGPWWYLENLVAQEVRTVITGTDKDGNPVLSPAYCQQFTLNCPLQYKYVAGPPAQYNFGYAFITSRPQIAAILDFAKACGAWLQYDPADIVDIPVIAKDVLNITCAEAIRRQVENVDAVCWFDHSHNPPKFHCQRRQALPAITRGLGNDYQAQGFKLKRRNDLSVPYVQICYKTPYNVGNVHTFFDVYDNYPNPAPPVNKWLKALLVTVALRAISGTVHTKYIKTERMQPDSLDWWKRRKPELDAAVNPRAAIDYAELELLPGTAARAAGDGTPNLPNMIVDGGWSDFMGGQVSDEQVTVSARYHRRYSANIPGTKISAHTLRAHCKTTNLDFPKGIEFKQTAWTSTGEGLNYVGLAQMIYEDLNAPAWEGVIPLYEAGYTGEVVLGENLNLARGRAEWSTMNALVRELGFSVRRGGIFYKASVGPNKKLTAAQLVDRLRASRQAFVWTADHNPTPINMTRHQVSNTLSDAEPMVSDHSVCGVDPVSQTVGVVFSSGGAAEPVLKLQVLKPDGTIDDTAGAINLAGKDGQQDWNCPGGPVQAPVSLDPSDAKGSDGNWHPVALREISVCVKNPDGSNTAKKMIVFGSLPF